MANHTVNPLALYVPIKQDDTSQALAALAVATFAGKVKDGLDAVGIVHFALLTAIPNPPLSADCRNLKAGGIHALMLHTTFDGAMTPYLDAFWKVDGTKNAFEGLAKLAMKETAFEEFDDFVNFINSNNIAGDLYRAYDKSVDEILGR